MKKLQYLSAILCLLNAFFLGQNLFSQNTSYALLVIQILAIGLTYHDYNQVGQRLVNKLFGDKK